VARHDPSHLKVMDRLWRMFFAPNFTSLSRSVVMDHRSTSTGNARLETGPILNARVSPRRVPLLGPEARE
jgi:hypothetical protein